MLTLCYQTAYRQANGAVECQSKLHRRVGIEEATQAEQSIIDQRLIDLWIDVKTNVVSID